MFACRVVSEKMLIVIYRVGQKNRGHFVLRPITLEILNRSLPNLAQITVSSFWTSCHNLFESTLENSGAIWRITLTVNKKVISDELAMTALCGSLCHILWKLLSSFCQLRRNLDDGRPSAELHPRWQVNRAQIWAIRCTKCLAQWTEGSRAASFCVSGGVRGSTLLLQWPLN